MTEVRAVKVTAVEGGALTTERAYGLLRFRTETNDVLLAVPTLQLHDLGVLALSLAPQTAISGPGEGTSLQALTANWVNCGIAEGGALVMTFGLTEGGSVTFHLKRPALNALRESLTDLAASPLDPSTRRLI
jgi:hypothetical protein